MTLRLFRTHRVTTSATCIHYCGFTVRAYAGCGKSSVSLPNVTALPIRRLSTVCTEIDDMRARVVEHPTLFLCDVALFALPRCVPLYIVTYERARFTHGGISARLRRRAVVWAPRAFSLLRYCILS